jgi:outer membrane protein assembly factor BamB
MGYASAADWPTFGHDSARSSVDAGRGLSPKTVVHLRLRWRVTLGDVADSAPILVSHARVKGRELSLLFITARDGTTYAIDAGKGQIIWRFATSGPGITTSVPVADPSGLWIYAPGVDGFVHKLETATGTEVRARGFPVQITRIPQTEKDASSLNLANGYLYATTSGYFGDAPPYVGHLVAIRLTDGSSRVFNTLCSKLVALPTQTSCNRSGSGIWARAGAVVDPDPSMNGRIYIATGNGNFDANHHGSDYGDSVVALSRDGTRLSGYYTPSNFYALDGGDVDLGSSAPVVLPREARSRTPLLAVQGGKDGLLRLLDRAHLGGVGGEIQRLDIGGGLYSAPAVWREGAGTTWIYLGLASGVRALRTTTDPNGKTRLVEVWSSNAGETPEGTSPVVSNGIVFIAMNRVIVALDGRTGTRLWTSAQAGAGSSIGGTHWESPIVVNGWIYCSDEDGHLSAYAPP